MHSEGEFDIMFFDSKQKAQSKYLKEWWSVYDTDDANILIEKFKKTPRKLRDYLKSAQTLCPRKFAAPLQQFV